MPACLTIPLVVTVDCLYVCLPVAVQAFKSLQIDLKNRTVVAVWSDHKNVSVNVLLSKERGMRIEAAAVVELHAITVPTSNSHSSGSSGSGFMLIFII